MTRLGNIVSSRLLNLEEDPVSKRFVMNYHYSSHLYQDTLLLSLFCALITTVESRWLIENRDLSLAFWTQGSQSNSSSQQLMGLCVESSEGGGERGRRGWTFVLLQEKLSGAKEKHSQELNPHNLTTIIICLLKTLILHISTPPTSGNTFKPLNSLSNMDIRTCWLSSFRWSFVLHTT